MARSPNWERDELILALDLYTRRGHLGRGDRDVVELSALLRTLPLHPEPHDISFRNPSSVAMKLGNLAFVDPNYPGGLHQVGAADVRVFEEFSGREAELALIAAEIRRVGATEKQPPAIPEEDEAGVPEGRLLYRLHRSRERDRGLVQRKKATVLATSGKLTCEACGLDPVALYGDLGDAVIECHHLRPLAVSGPRTTRLADVVLLCANCHRAIHRTRPWPTLAIFAEDLAQRNRNVLAPRPTAHRPA